MPNIGLIISLIAVFAWVNDYITTTAFWTLVVILVTWDVLFAHVSLKFGFVSRAKHEELKAKYKELESLSDRVTDALEEAREKLSNVEDYYYSPIEMKHIKECAVISGQDAVFRAFIENKALFQKHLNIFIAEKLNTQAKSKQQNSNNTNKKGEPVWYKVLGVASNTDYATAKAAYRSLCMKFHPDKPGGSEDKMKTINVAWAQAEAHFGK